MIKSEINKETTNRRCTATETGAAAALQSLSIFDKLANGSGRDCSVLQWHSFVIGLRPEKVETLYSAIQHDNRMCGSSQLREVVGNKRKIHFLNSPLTVDHLLPGCCSVCLSALIPALQ